MSQKIDLIELYLPDCQMDWSDILQAQVELVGWDFLVHFATESKETSISEWSQDFDKALSHYFFNMPNQIIPHGALCAYFCDRDKPVYWMKADPVHYVLDINQGFIVPAEISGENQSDFLEKINHFLAQDGLSFVRIDEKNGLLGSNSPIYYEAPSLLNVVNKNIYFEQVSGQDKAYYQKLGAELQLLFRQHKINEQAPDGLYLWGTGVLPEQRPKSYFDTIMSTDYSVLGLAKLANISVQKINHHADIKFQENQGKNIGLITQDFSLHWRTGNKMEFVYLLDCYNKILLELISLVKNNRLDKLVLNTGQKKYQLTKWNIIKSYFLKYVQFKKEWKKNGQSSC